MLNKEIEDLLKEDADRFYFSELEERLDDVLTPPTYHDPDPSNHLNLEKIYRARGIQILMLQVESIKTQEIAYEGVEVLKALDIWMQINNYEDLKNELERVKAEGLDLEFAE